MVNRCIIISNKLFSHPFFIVENNTRTELPCRIGSLVHGGTDINLVIVQRVLGNHCGHRVTLRVGIRIFPGVRIGNVSTVALG